MGYGGARIRITECSLQSFVVGVIEKMLFNLDVTTARTTSLNMKNRTCKHANRDIKMIEKLEISTEDLDRAIRNLRKRMKLTFLDSKLKSGEKLTDDDLNQLIEIDRFAEEHNLPELHEKVAKIIVSIEKTIPAEEIELKEDEIKELNKDMVVRKRKDGIIEIKWN